MNSCYQPLCESAFVNNTRIWQSGQGQYKLTAIKATTKANMQSTEPNKLYRLEIGNLPAQLFKNAVKLSSAFSE